MSAIDWGSVADWVSGLGSVVASGVALHLAGAEGRARRDADRPTVSVKIDTRQDRDWVRLVITFDNPGNKQWDIGELTIRKPSHGLLVLERACYLPGPPDEPWKIGNFSEAARDQAAARAVNIGGVIEPYSAKASSGSAKYTTTRLTTLLAKVGAEATGLRMELSFTSRDAVPDRFAIKVVRSIEAAPAAL